MSWVLTGALAAGGGLMGYMKHQKEVDNENKQRDLVSNMQRYSYATGQTADPSQIQRAGSLVGDVGQGALAGGMMGQNIKNTMASNARADALNNGMIDQMKNGQVPYWGQVYSLYGQGNQQPSLLGMNYKLPGTP